MIETLPLLVTVVATVYASAVASQQLLARHVRIPLRATDRTAAAPHDLDAR